MSLQILQSESHPNMFNQGPGKKSSSEKEGLSMFGLFRRFAYTPQGKARLKQVFFRPSLNLDVIRERHDFIGIFSRPDNTATLEKMTKALKHIKNLRPIMINLHKGISTGTGKTTGFKATVWESLLAVCGQHCSIVRDSCLQDKVRILRDRHARCFTRDLGRRRNATADKGLSTSLICDTHTDETGSTRLRGRTAPQGGPHDSRDRKSLQIYLRSY